MQEMTNRINGLILHVATTQKSVFEVMCAAEGMGVVLTLRAQKSVFAAPLLKVAEINKINIKHFSS